MARPLIVCLIAVVGEGRIDFDGWWLCKAAPETSKAAALRSRPLSYTLAAMTVNVIRLQMTLDTIIIWNRSPTGLTGRTKS